MAKQAPYTNEADYVVVGSGSSGAAVAGRLAESGASVIVLEAGKSDEQFLVKKPGHDRPDARRARRSRRRVDWGYYSTPQEHLLEPQDARAARQGGRRLELDQRHGLRARQPRQLRLLGGRGQHRLGRRLGQHRLQADGGLRGRRQRLPRRRRADPDHPQQDAAGGHPPVHPGRPPTRSACKILDDYNAERRRASAGCSRTLPTACATAPPAATSTTSTCRRWSCRPRCSSPRCHRERPGGRRRGRSTRTAPRGSSAPARRSSSPPASSGRRSC